MFRGTLFPLPAKVVKKFFPFATKGHNFMAKARAWCWTLNNPTEDDVAAVDAIRVGPRGGEGDPPDFRYLCYGREVGESGTPHLQGYAYAWHPVSLSFVRARIPRAHFEISRGRPDQAISYCEKDGDFHEQGERPASQAQKGAGERERWDRARENARDGDLEAVDSDIYLRYYRTLKEIAKDHMPKVDDHSEVTGVWIYGESGIGKSRKARADFPEAYLKMANKWWDGYQGEDNVILDDLDTKHDCLGHHLKIWADRYAFIAETKGGAIKIRPKRLVVTSQYRIDQIWRDEETVAALKRRFRVIHMDGFVLPVVA